MANTSEMLIHAEIMAERELSPVGSLETSKTMKSFTSMDSSGPHTLPLTPYLVDLEEGLRL